MPTKDAAAARARTRDLSPDLRAILSSCPPLTREQHQELLARVVASDDPEALGRLVKHNLRFVVKVARRWAKDGIELDVLVGAGMEGLVEAARRWDMARKASFLTYAEHWIAKRVRECAHHEGNTVRLPVPKSGPMPKAAMVSITVKPGRGEEGADAVTERDLVAPDQTDRPAEQQRLADLIYQGLAFLSGPRREIVELRFGLNHTRREMSISEAGEALGLSREQAQSLLRRRLKTLREGFTRRDLHNAWERLDLTSA